MGAKDRGTEDSRFTIPMNRPRYQTNSSESSEMITNQAFRYELKTNNKQCGLLTKHCGVARFAWNWGLARRKELYSTRSGKDRFTSAMTQNKELNAIKRVEFPWMYEASKCAPEGALWDLDRAYTNFYRGLRNHKRIGLPRFKKKGIHGSFYLQGVRVLESGLALPKMGLIRTKEATNKFKGRILSATVSREADRWYCSLTVEVDRLISQPIIGDVVGVDLGLETFAVIHDGREFDKADSPKPLKKNLKKLRKLSRQQSRKRKGSYNRRKANIALARLHRRIRNTRKDFLNKLTTGLAKTKSAIVVENLNVQGLQSKKRHLGKSINDVGWYEFRRQLAYKTKWYGSRLIVVGRFEATSKMCSACGTVNESLTLDDLTWICMSCEAVHDRDENAAVNIRNSGLKILSTESSSGINACGVSVSPPIEAVHDEAGSKQDSL